MGLALRALALDVEASPLHMMPHAGAGSSAASSSSELDLELRLAPPPPGDGDGDDSVDESLFRLDLERRNTLKEALAQGLETRIADEYSAPPEGAPSPKACVEALIERWGAIYPRGRVYIDGNGPEPGRDDLKGLNGKLQHAVNALAGKDGPAFRQTLGQIDLDRY